MESSFIEGVQNFEKEWTLEFHGVSYVINIAASEIMVTIEAEQIDANERWSGEFTSQYIEEITHKAGSFKKFPVFVKMLCSAFSRESESVFADLLTFNDLELLKARKLGTAQTGNNHSNSNSKSNLKRYVILTYAAEFDRVHFPLPLSHEDIPNVDSLMRTIRQLRKQIREMENKKNEPTSEKDRELRQIDSNLRKENTELKHRLRQLESRSGTGNLSSSSNGQSENQIIVKIRRQNETLQRELTEMTNAYERMKYVTTKEISKWKTLAQSSALSNASAQSLPPPSSKYKSSSTSNGGPGDGNATAVKGRYMGAKTISGGGSRSGSHHHSASDNNHHTTSRSRSVSPSNSTKFYHYNGKSSTSHNTAYNASKRHVSSSKSPQRPTSSSLHASSKTTRPQSEVTSSKYNNDPRSRSPSSSLGGRFDPTAYATKRNNDILEAKKRMARGVHNRYESGYSSATSNSSNGSRGSQRSKASSASYRSSDRSVSVTSRSSHRSGSSANNRENDTTAIEKKRKKKKKKKSHSKRSQSDELLSHYDNLISDSNTHKPSQHDSSIAFTAGGSNSNIRGNTSSVRRSKEDNALRVSSDVDVDANNGRDGRRQYTRPPLSTHAAVSGPHRTTGARDTHDSSDDDDDDNDSDKDFRKHVSTSSSKSALYSSGTRSSKHDSYVDQYDDNINSRGDNKDGDFQRLRLGNDDSASKYVLRETERLSDIIKSSEPAHPTTETHPTGHASDKYHSQGSKSSRFIGGNQLDVLQSGESAASLGGGKGEISDIDKRIQALQHFLEKARSGIMSDVDDAPPSSSSTAKTYTDKNYNTRLEEDL